MSAIHDLIANAKEVRRAPRVRSFNTKAVKRKPSNASHSGGEYGRLQRGIRRKPLSQRQLDKLNRERVKLAEELATPR